MDNDKNVLNSAENLSGCATGYDDAKTLIVDATDDNLETAMAFVTEYLEEKGCGIRLVNQMSIAFEEIFINVAHYAYHPNVGQVEIKLKLDGDKISLIFIDGGKKYDPLAKPDPDVSLSADDREIGGLGIFMVKKLVDRMAYDYVDGKNILLLEKSL